MTPIALGFAGRITSGKSTVSERVAECLGVPRVSFRRYLEAVASQRGIRNVTREVLQDLGEQEINARGYKQFCVAVLSQADWRPGESVVIDGIRHLEVVEALREVVAPAEFHLVYIIIDPETQRSRLPNSLPHQKTIEELERHSTEVQVPVHLLRAAELTLDARKQVDELTEEVLRWVRKAAS